MGIDKSLLTSSTIMLLLKLLEEKDMYGYMMIEELSKKSGLSVNRLINECIEFALENLPEEKIKK